MFGRTELERLRRQKDLLVRQSDTSRVALAAEWQRLRSVGYWRSEATLAVRQHPFLAAVLGIGSGIVALRALRQPGVALSWLGRLGGAGSALLSIWNLLGRK